MADVVEVGGHAGHQRWMPVGDAIDERAEPHALGDAGERGKADPGIGLHRGVIEDVAAVESECFHLPPGFEQPPQALVPEHELNAPADSVVGRRDPWMTRHACPCSRCSGARMAPFRRQDAPRASSRADARSPRRRARARARAPMTRSVSNSPGDWVRPVTATRTGMKRLPGFSPSASARARKRASVAASSSRSTSGKIAATASSAASASSRVIFFGTRRADRMAPARDCRK